MKILCPLAALLFVLGCAKFSDNVFRTEQTAANLAFGAYIGYTNGLYSGAIHVTPAQSNEVKQARMKLGASLGTCEGWRSAYATNSAVQNQVQAALDSVLLDASNIVYLVHLFKQ